MTVDKEYCMSSFLMFRTIADQARTFAEGLRPDLFTIDFERTPVRNYFELETILKTQVEDATRDGKAALALSGGIDSAILAKYMPEGSVAYTFKCVVPGIEVMDETLAAARYAKECGLNHKVVEIYWEDFGQNVPLLMRHKGAPIHSIEVQIYKAALQAKKDGLNKLIFGESADLIYGGLSGLLSKDWTVGEFISRYSYVLPYYVLKYPKMIYKPYYQYQENGYVDVHAFDIDFFFREAMGTYTNACCAAGIEFVAPYSKTLLGIPIDIGRIRKGENKYLVREIFKSLYHGFEVPPKTPMPRPMNEWMKGWGGPTRPEFWPHCTDHMTGDQKWLVYCLEWFLNLLEEWSLGSDRDRKI